MSLRLLLRTLVVAIAFAAATAISWWALPIAAAIFGAITARDRAGPVVAAAGAVTAWGAILLWTATRGPLSTVAVTLGGILQARPVAVYVLTLAFAGLLARGDTRGRRQTRLRARHLRPVSATRRTNGAMSPSRSATQSGRNSATIRRCSLRQRRLRQAGC
jgi:hypothetical protein